MLPLTFFLDENSSVMLLNRIWDIVLRGMQLLSPWVTR